MYPDAGFLKHEKLFISELMGFGMFYFYLLIYFYSLAVPHIGS